MAKQQGSARVRTTIRIKEPQMYDVVIFNDDFTTMEFVVEVLTEVFYHPRSVAEALMLKIHHEGKAVAGTYIYDIAVSKAEQVKSYARKNNFPLRLEVVAHK